MRSCLVIDNSEIVRKVARTIIESFEYFVTEAQTSDDALARCRRAMPNVVMIDWHLTGCDSHEIVRSIRTLNADHQPYIIYCTTENDPIDIAQAMSSGVDDYLLKPFDRAALESKFTSIPFETA